MPQVTINGKETPFEPGQTIVEAAASTGVKIPTLCHFPEAHLTGVCRICVVEVKGYDRLLPACETQALDGMEIETHSPEVVETRKAIISMLLDSGRHNCYSCEAAGDCVLETLSYEYEVSPEDPPAHNQHFPLDEYSDFLVRDFSRCVQCGRCIAACNEIQINRAIRAPYGRRGDKPQGWYPKADYTFCTQCGECIQACPVGALTEKKSRGLARSWELEKVRTTCTYCGVGCQVWLHVKDGRIIKVSGVEDAEPNLGRLCAKGRFGFDFVHSEERLTTPLIKVRGKFKEASWDEALDLVAAKFKEIRKQSGADSLAGLAGAHATNEDSYLHQKFMRAAVGTNNVDTYSEDGDSAVVESLDVSLGSGAMTNSIGEMVDCDLMLLIGSDTTENHPVIGSTLRQGIVRNGAKLIVANHRRVNLCDDAAMWMRQRPGSEVALINGMINVILEEGLEDAEFIADRTENFKALKKAVADYTPSKVAKMTGVLVREIKEAALLYARAERAAIFYDQGITGQAGGADCAQALANLAMVCGHIGRASTGVNPLRGQNNLQGACDMGGLPGDLPGHQKVSDVAARKEVAKAWGRKTLPAKAGLSFGQMLEEAKAGGLKGMLVLGADPAGTEQTGKKAAAALKKLDFLVVQDIFLTATAKLADVVLPAASWAEKDGTFTNTERRVQRIRKAVDAPGRAADGWWAVDQLAARLNQKWGYSGPKQIMDEIAKVNPAYGGITYSRLERADGLQWPCPTTRHPGTPVLHAQEFTRGKGLFAPVGHQ